MTIRRQYSLPNCTLIVEGLSDSIYTTEQSDTRPLVSIVVNAECHFVGKAQPLTGGREFLESLVTAVNSYAQESLSRVPRPASHNGKPALVQLKKGSAEHLHRLTIQPITVTDAVRNGGNGGQASAISERHPEMPEVVPASGASPTQIDLTTVQMFDLVEACDQFQADSRTVPDISLHLSPISKRNVAAGSPIAKRAAPAAVGVTSLAVCAIALSFIPVPRVNPPAPPPPPQSKSTATPTPKPKSDKPPKKSKPQAAAPSAPPPPPQSKSTATLTPKPKSEAPPK